MYFFFTFSSTISNGFSTMLFYYGACNSAVFYSTVKSHMLLVHLVSHWNVEIASYIFL